MRDAPRPGMGQAPEAGPPHQGRVGAQGQGLEQVGAAADAAVGQLQLFIKRGRAA